MINSITVTNHLGDSITMEMRNPEYSGFLIRSIGGLGPSKAEINKTDISVLDGSFYNSSRTTSRDIRLELTFLREPSIEAVRLKSYKYFPIEKRVKLEINTDSREAYVYGYVESNEPNIFSKEEGTVIVIKCMEAYFYSLVDGLVVFSSITPVFECPFSNESLVTKLINMGDIAYETTKNIYYEGDSEVGVVFVIRANGTVNNLVITKVSTGETIELDSSIIIAITGADISAGDVIVLSTVVGEKYITLTRSGTVYNIRNAIGKYPEWFKLDRGDNEFSYSADSGVTNLQFEVSFKIAYEGV